MPDFDAIIIGTGQAGPSLAFRLAGAGTKVAVVERHLVGGTCVNTGCTPTKALIASAYAARIARRALECGVVIGVISASTCGGLKRAWMRLWRRREMGLPRPGSYIGLDGCPGVQ